MRSSVFLDGWTLIRRVAFYVSASGIPVNCYLIDLSMNSLWKQACLSWRCLEFSANDSQEHGL